MDARPFTDKSVTPDNDSLSQVLGRAFKLWTGLKEHVLKHYEGVGETWVYGGKKGGWYLKLATKKRSVLFMAPDEKHLRATLLFNEKAIEAARQSGLSAEVIDLFANAIKYPEGHAVRLQVKTAVDARLVEKLVAIKMTN